MKNLKIKAIVIIGSIFFIGNAMSQTMLWDEKYTETIFFDDFSGSVLDNNLWNVCSAFKRDIGLLIDSTATVNVSNGNLELTMIGCPNCEVTDWAGNKYYGDYAGGEIVSKEQFLYGIFECRAKYAQEDGSWPAFWLIGGDGIPCPPGGYANEIDMFEYFCRSTGDQMEHNIRHYHPPVNCVESVDHRVNQKKYSFNANALYHDFKCVWTPNKISYYLDGALKHEVTNTGQICSETGQYWFPEFALNLILSQQITNPGSTPIVPQTTYFDRVSVKRFFPTPEITCPNVVCSTETATLDVDPEASNITWTLSPGAYFSGATSGTGKTVTITPSGNYNGTGKIKFNFSMPSGETFSAEQTFGVKGPRYEDITFNVLKSDGTPANQVSGTWLMCPNTTYHIYVNNNNSSCSTSGYSWSVPSNWTQFYTYQNMISINTNSSPGGPVSVNANTCCNNFVNIIMGYMGTDYNCGYYSMSFSPNPTTGETMLILESNSDEITFDETARWGLEVYSETQLLKTRKTGLRGQSAKIQTAGWQEGVYLVRVNYKGEILTGKLLVKN